jgi:ketosteroid isomerase-like protein
MPVGCGHFEGLQDVLERFLARFYEAFDVRFAAEEFIAAGDTVVAIGRIEGKTRKAGVPIDVAFAHVWAVRAGYLQRLRAFTDTTVLTRVLESLEFVSAELSATLYLDHDRERDPGSSAWYRGSL